MNRSAAWIPTARGIASATLAIALLSIQFAVIQFAPTAIVVRATLPATIALVPLALWVYRGHIGVWVIFVGLTANLCAILANGGLMPIERATVVDAIGMERGADYATGEWIHGSKDVLVDQDASLVALGDSIAIEAGGRGMVISPGDIVIWSGLMILVLEGSIAWQRRTRRDATAARGGAAAERGATT